MQAIVLTRCGRNTALILPTSLIVVFYHDNVALDEDLLLQLLFNNARSLNLPASCSMLLPCNSVLLGVRYHVHMLKQADCIHNQKCYKVSGLARYDGKAVCLRPRLFDCEGVVIVTQ
jgi:hypothetical protein